MSFNLLLKSGVTWIHVLSASGESSGLDGTSSSITNAADRAILLEARKQADWILVSADTFIAEHYKPSKHAPIAVITRDESKRLQILEQHLESASNTQLHPVTVFDSVDDFLCATNKATESKILLESGRSMASALVREGRIHHAVVTIAGSVTDQGAAALSLLCVELDLDPVGFRHIHDQDQLNVWFSSIEG